LRQPLTERYRERLAGVLSCYDRIGGTDLFLAFEGQNCGFPVIDCAAIHIEWTEDERAILELDSRMRNLNAALYREERALTANELKVETGNVVSVSSMWIGSLSPSRASLAAD
jgi:hypothetical protein